MTDDTINPNTLDPHTLRELKRVLEAYPVVTSDIPYHELSDYRVGKRDAYTTAAAKIDQWLDDIEEA